VKRIVLFNMKGPFITSIAALWLAFIDLATHAAPTGPQLTHWPPAAAEALNKMIAANAHKGNYAVFDMDNTRHVQGFDSLRSHD
jgi:phosphorylcholine phosphatase